MVLGGSQAPEFALGDGAKFGREEIPQSVGGVVAAEAVFVGVGFEDVFGAVGVVV